MMRERSALWTGVVGKWEPRDKKRERPNQRNGQGAEDKAVRNPGIPLLAHREAVSFKDDIPGPQGVLDQSNSRQTTEDGHQGVDHKPLMPANGLDGHGGGSRRGEFVRHIELRIIHRRSRIVVHVATVSPLAPVAAHR